MIGMAAGGMKPAYADEQLPITGEEPITSQEAYQYNPALIIPFYAAIIVVLNSDSD